VAATEAPEPSDLPDWVPDSIEAALTAGAEDKVSLFVLDSAERVRGVRASVRSEGVVALAEDAFALESGRIVVANLDAAERILVEAGWIDRKLEILTTASLRAQTRPEDSRGIPSSADADYPALLSKPTLTPGEAMQALEMLDGL